MTKEEAITIMQLYKEELEHRIAKIDYDIREIDLYSIHLDAFEVAIEALSAEAVTHGRLIDADALSEKLCETTIFIKDGEVFQRMINDAPTVSAEAVQGEWTYLSGSKGSYMTISCPICGSTFDDVAEWKYNYCPNCGADMRGSME